MSATPRLKPHDERAFDTAVADRMDPVSPDYHRWMTAAQIASFGASADAVGTLVRSLQAAGLTVSARGDSDALRVTASAAEAAFGTALHAFEASGQRTRAPPRSVRIMG